MSTRVLAVLALALTASLSAPAQQATPTPAQPEPPSAEQPDTSSKDINVIYGRIKEVKAGQKIVIQVDNARDKTYNLADKERAIKISDDLAIGDPVKVLEAKGTKAVHIVRDTGGDSAQDKRSRSSK
jgi:hypothetical protein